MTRFARFKVGGKLIRQTLNTAVFSVARQRLPDKMRDYRSRHESVKAFANGKMTVGDAVEVYLGKVRSSVSLKPRSKDYRAMMIDFIANCMDRGCDWNRGWATRLTSFATRTATMTIGSSKRLRARATDTRIPRKIG